MENIDGGTTIASRVKGEDTDRKRQLQEHHVFGTTSSLSGANHGFNGRIGQNLLFGRRGDPAMKPIQADPHLQ